MPRETGGRQLQRWRFENRKNQKELAAILGVVPSTLCRIEAGKGRPTVSLAVKIEKKTGIPVTVWT
jgi:transcriptional regulator with XRE-family HTH domain